MPVLMLILQTHIVLDSWRLSAKMLRSAYQL